MTFPILVEPIDGQFVAKLVGEQELKVVGGTREEALAAMTSELQQRVERGELVSVEIVQRGASAVAGKFADDPTLVEICDEIYTDRDHDAVGRLG